MKAQSVLAPLKVELILDNKQGEEYSKPMQVKTYTYMNKGKAKEHYEDRLKKNFGVDKVEVNWS